MEVLGIIAGIIFAILLLMTIFSAVAAFFIMTGPPDAYDVDIEGKPKRNDN